ncbi:MAG: phospho-N-acetylmuramoyl-pentapeptide-transferase [Dehalococcoidia bacterium]|jgi:phospho-N-acetylmuramoyl-pentapeptide-transferase|uniref:phospho-N-acetylmuramoyl-pentapeptide- transferase n=1 Tax=Candidatus Amarobacter glycogenicus TaxID=3140699 RepID=UPI002A133067|nr:phospho-N-acetylmuramoyl-pentapeptide-transferase [Dehalococcoidia bacterium]MBK9343989.1 phospho-N-acetylmuramoyl-pentapeptide-transferase [Dehalococcoidia bacterium]MBK9547385.1 phospho-N-acetylmuramoyl-pentapeptide-transferase [Dehalococcoidia bacterium]MBK9612092.1 phospho-N-acetylmuramoyl-pentapeptide-transferase [Dehalococcoidia bacterium]
MIHALFSGVITFFIAVAVGSPIVNYLRRQKIGKEISEYLPEHQHKAGTPTFGGFIIWLPTFVVTAVAVDWWKHQSILLPLGMIGITMAAGFVDDLGTLQHRAQKGLSWRFKITFTALFAVAAAVVLYEYIEVESINIPYVGSYSLGLFYIPLAAGVIVATTSAVAVSDGMDGLAGGTTLIAFIAYGIVGFIQGQEFVATFAFIIAGSTLGFLWYNAHPARVIMGDTGALALGSSLAVIALMTGQWLLLPVIGIVFVAEMGSNLIQIGYFKLSGGKRVFKRAPFHHHLNLIGWAETQVVTRFWLVSIVAAMAGVALALEVPD